MSHAVSTFIGAQAPIRKLSLILRGARTCRVRNDRYLFLPITDDMFDLATELKTRSDLLPGGLSLFTVALAELAAEASAQGPIVYAWTDYFGGKGTQGAMAWDKGHVLSPPRLGSGSINLALQLLGVKAEPPMDEFDTVGLGSARSNDRFDDFPQAD
jgi:hypothetical protein